MRHVTARCFGAQTCAEQLREDGDVHDVLHSHDQRLVLVVNRERAVDSHIVLVMKGARSESHGRVGVVEKAWHSMRCPKDIGLPEQENFSALRVLESRRRGPAPKSALAGALSMPIS